MNVAVRVEFVSDTDAGVNVPSLLEAEGVMRIIPLIVPLPNVTVNGELFMVTSPLAGPSTVNPASVEDALTFKMTGEGLVSERLLANEIVLLPA